MSAAQHEDVVATTSTLPPSCVALLDQFGARIRAGLDATGLPYTAADVHAVMHEHAPAVAARLAELILLLVPPDQDDEHDETRIDTGGDPQRWGGAFRATSAGTSARGCESISRYGTTV